MSFTAEPFFLPIGGLRDPATDCARAGFNEAGVQAMSAACGISDYAGWKRTRIVLSVNPLRTALNQGPGDAAFTEGVMRDCRNTLGVRCVFDNHDLYHCAGEAAAAGSTR